MNESVAEVILWKRYTQAVSNRPVETLEYKVPLSRRRFIPRLRPTYSSTSKAYVRHLDTPTGGGQLLKIKIHDCSYDSQQGGITERSD